jgi:hypothetical protein
LLLGESVVARVFEKGYGREGWHFKKRNCVLNKDYWTWKGCGIEFKAAREKEIFVSKRVKVLLSASRKGPDFSLLLLYVLVYL